MKSSVTESSTSDSEAVGKLFSRLSEAYSRHFALKRTGVNFCFRRRLELAVELAQPCTGRLLDCATGTGEIASAILQTGRFPWATLVDISQTMLDRADQCLAANLRDLPGLRLDLARSDIFEFAPNPAQLAFNLVLCLGLIAHTGRLTALLEHLRNMVTKDGVIILQTTLAEHPCVRLVRALTQERYYRQNGYRIAYFRSADILESARVAGFRVDAVRRFTLSLPLGDRIWPWGNYHAEQLLCRWAARFGAEALYRLQRQ